MKRRSVPGVKWLPLLFVAVLSSTTARSDEGGRTTMTLTGINYGSVVTLKGSPIDKDHWVGSQELMGIRVEENGKGPFHNVSTHIAIIVYVDKDGAKVHGYETHTDKDGDKVIWEISAVDDPKRPGWQNGQGKVVGATGKFAGMEGTMDYVVKVDKGFPEGTFRTTCREHMTVSMKTST